MPTAPRTPADREEGVTAPEAQGGGLAPGHEALVHTGQQPGEVNLGDGGAWVTRMWVKFHIGITSDTV